jgi:hypothetical protein
MKKVCSFCKQKHELEPNPVLDMLFGDQSHKLTVCPNLPPGTVYEHVKYDKGPDGRLWTFLR